MIIFWFSRIVFSRELHNYKPLFGPSVGPPSLRPSVTVNLIFLHFWTLEKTFGDGDCLFKGYFESLYLSACLSVRLFLIKLTPSNYLVLFTWYMVLLNLIFSLMHLTNQLFNLLCQSEGRNQSIGPWSVCQWYFTIPRIYRWFFEPQSLPTCMQFGKLCT